MRPYPFLALLLVASLLASSAPAAYKPGALTSGASSPYRVESATIVCSSSSAITRQSGSWVSAVANISSNRCAVTIASGIFSATPTCTAIDQTTSTTSTVGTHINITSSTAFSIGCVFNTGASTSACSTDTFHVICMGPR